MIRILQQDNRFTKAIFAVVIGAAIVTMVITLVPGIFDNGAANDTTVYATVRNPGIFGKFAGREHLDQDGRRAARSGPAGAPQQPIQITPCSF